MLKRIYKKLRSFRKKPKDDILERFPFLNPGEHYRLKLLAEKLLEKSGGEVFHGPLSGLKILPNSHLANRPMFAVGCYEQEIHEVLSEIICSPPQQMIEIGSAYGYYMVGMALQLQKTKVIGFEAVECPHWKEAAELAELNGVYSQIIQKGLCTCEELQGILGEGDFLLSDCEGGERELLNPEKIPALKNCRILCEVHDFISPRITALLVERFKETHLIKLMHEKPRNPDQFRILDGLSEIDRLLCVKETRHFKKHLTTNRFLYFSPRCN
jgi:hypothetical protein